MFQIVGLPRLELRGPSTVGDLQRPLELKEGNILSKVLPFLKLHRLDLLPLPGLEFDLLDSADRSSIFHLAPLNLLLAQVLAAVFHDGRIATVTVIGARYGCLALSFEEARRELPSRLRVLVVRNNPYVPPE